MKKLNNNDNQAKAQELTIEFRNSLTRITVLENKLNHCTKDEHDEIAIELLAENERFGRLKKELTKVY